MRTREILFLGVVGVVMASFAGRTDAVVISEFMASNGSTLEDESRQFPDWIELYNDDLSAVNLAGWFLTDDRTEPEKWEFPELVLGPGEFLVVLASGRDLRDPEGELHANFGLSSGGEYLALVTPGGLVASQFSPGYPTQLADFSYGVPMTVSSRSIVATGATLKYLVPRNSLLGTTWAEVDFDDSEWTPGLTPIGYDSREEPVFYGVIQTDVGLAMEGVNSGIFMRFPFTLNSDDRFLQLRVSYNDGVIVLINGVELARVNAVSGSRRYNLRAGRARNDDATLALQRVPLTYPLPPGLLVTGDNVLGLWVINTHRDDQTAFCLPELDIVEVESVQTTSPGYFGSPTPGQPNLDARSGIAPTPVFLTAAGVHEQAGKVEIAPPPPGVEVRYTTDGAVPTIHSTLYDGPLVFEAFTVVKARGFQPGMLPSPTAIHNLLVRQQGFNADSSLPLVVVSVNSGIGEIFRPMSVTIIDRNEAGRAHLRGDVHFMGSGFIKKRGSSTRNRLKSSYSIEIQDETGGDLDVEILGFPPESDFVLYGAYNFDRAHIRNAFVYELSNDVGRYAVRTRFCELYVTLNRGTLSARDYRGVYTFMEKIKRDDRRVNIEQLRREHDGEPEITGGYIVKIDRLDPGDRGFVGGGQQMAFVDPKEPEIILAQKEWFVEFLDDFNRSLSGPDAEDPELGYRAFIDELSWIDHHLINEFTKNPDALRLSTYLFKNRNGKLENGPVWDFDRTLGPDDDGRAQNPVGWMGPHNSSWWGKLLQIPRFFRSYRLRWRELREGPLRLDHLEGIIDRMAGEIREAAGRDAARWRQVAGVDGWEEEVQQLRTWVARRVEWIDSQLLVRPTFDPPGGRRLPRGAEISVVDPPGEIFYTINGLDPVLAGQPVSGAILYTGPISITANTRLRARARFSAMTWSSMAEATYVTDAPSLAVTEVMYRPLAGRPEFIELLNFGAAPISLVGWRFAGGMRYDFADGPKLTLDPGEYLVVARYPELFGAFHDTRVNVVGPYDGVLSDRDLGMEIKLLGPLDEPFVVFRYNYWWHPSTDGKGHSLIPVDPHSDPSGWTVAQSWRPSFDVGGSPGRDDEEAVAGLQLSGDIDQSGARNIADAVALLLRLFDNNGPGLPCQSAAGNRALADLNGDERGDLSDVVHLLAFLFQNGPPPAAGVDCQPISGCPDLCEPEA